MLQQRAFHFKGPDAITGTFDHIILAPDKPEIAVGVARGPVAGQIPVALELRRHFPRAEPIRAEQPRRAMRFDPDRHLALLAIRHFPQMLIEQRHAISRRGLAHRTRPHGMAQRTKVANQNHRFRLSVGFVESQAGRFAPAIEHFRVEWLAGGDAMPQVRETPARQILPNDEPQRRRRRAPGGNGKRGQRVERQHRIELSGGVQRKDAGAHVPRTVET